MVARLGARGLQVSELVDRWRDGVLAFADCTRVSSVVTLSEGRLFPAPIMRRPRVSFFLLGRGGGVIVEFAGLLHPPWHIFG